MSSRTLLLPLGLALALAACGSQQTAAPTAAQLAETAPQVAPATPQLPPGAPPLPPDLMAVGSQEARDDLYCSALIYNANPDLSDALAPVDEALLRKAQALGFIIGEAGINLIVTAKAAHATHARALADAYAAQVEKDVAAGRPRIPLDECNKRAAAIPLPE